MLFKNRDEYNLEVNAVRYIDDRRYALSEIKLFSSIGIEVREKSLVKLASLIDDKKIKKSFYGHYC